MENKAKQEAIRIYNEHYSIIAFSTGLLIKEINVLAKKLSIKCVEEIIKGINTISDGYFTNEVASVRNHYEQVKQELEKV